MLPAWITSQQATRAPCAYHHDCGGTAIAEVTWVDGTNHGTHLLCGPCMDLGAALARM